MSLISLYISFHLMFKTSARLFFIVLLSREYVQEMDLGITFDLIYIYSHYFISVYTYIHIYIHKHTYTLCKIWSAVDLRCLKGTKCKIIFFYGIKAVSLWLHLDLDMKSIYFVVHNTHLSWFSQSSDQIVQLAEFLCLYTTMHQFYDLKKVRSFFLYQLISGNSSHKTNI